MVLKKINFLWNTFFSKTFFLYVLFAGTATLFDWGSFYLFVYFLSYHYLVGTFLGFLIGSVVNFSLNKYFNFKNKYRIVGNQFSLFLVVAGLGLAISLLIMWFFVDFVHLNKMLARVVTTGLVLIYSFLGHKYLTFRILR